MGLSQFVNHFLCVVIYDRANTLSAQFEDPMIDQVRQLFSTTRDFKEEAEWLGKDPDVWKPRTRIYG
jgi:hypothetical protein